MSTTTTTGASASTTCGTSAQYELPVKDAACGVPNSSKYKGLIETCAQPAGVQAYDNNCALYAPAVNQSVQKLTDCLYDAGVEWADVWCYGSTNATATATSYPTATVTGNKKPTQTSSSTSSTSTTSTAPNSTSLSGADSTQNGRTTKMGVLSALVFLGLVFGM